MRDALTNEGVMTSSILRNNIERSLEIHNRLSAEYLPSLAAAADALISAYRTGPQGAVCWERWQRRGRAAFGRRVRWTLLT